MINLAQPIARAVGLLTVAFLATGCATTSGPRYPARLHPNAQQQFASIEKTAVLPPDIVLNEYTAGGVRERREDWTATARQNATLEIERLGGDRVVVLGDFSDNPDLAEEVRDIVALYQTIDINHATFAGILPNRPNTFEHSVGSVDRVLEQADADALLIIYGMDDYFTSGRQALSVLGFVAAATLGGGYMPSHGVDHVSAALIARDGTILWHNTVSFASRDLRTAEGIRQTLGYLLGPLPTSVRTATSTTTMR